MRNLIDAMLMSDGRHVLFNDDIDLVDNTAVYTCLCHTDP